MNDKQITALNKLYDAFEAVGRAGLIIWESNGSFYAMEGTGIEQVGPDPTLGPQVPEGNIDIIWRGSAWAGSFADDKLYAKGK